jgi:hypothetical protein
LPIAEFGGVDPVGDQQRVDSGPSGTRDVGAQAVADRQDTAPVGNSEQIEAAVINRWVRLAVPAHPAAEPFILLGQRAGTQRRLSVMDHDEVGVGAHHR